MKHSNLSTIPKKGRTKPSPLVKCTACGWRLMDKVTSTAGIIKIKCPHCHQVVTVDLSLRRGRSLY